MRDDFDQSPQEIVPDVRRRKLSKTDKLAALYLTMTVPLDDGTCIPFLLPEAAKRMTATEIVAVYERWHDWDHLAALGAGGSNHPLNLRPLDRHTHRTVKTPEDQARIAKAKRLEAKHAAVRAKLLAREPRERKQAPRKAKPLPGTKASGWRHRMDGVWERRPPPRD